MRAVLILLVLVLAAWWYLGGAAGAPMWSDPPSAEVDAMVEAVARAQGLD